MFSLAAMFFKYRPIAAIVRARARQGVPPTRIASYVHSARMPAIVAKLRREGLDTR
jgi:hypothetical protein